MSERNPADYVVVNDQEISIASIHERFSSTKYGQKLAGERRYEIFRPEPISPVQWIEILGPDANNLAHHDVAHGITRDLTIVSTPGQFSTDEIQDLALTAATHDWGEAVIGDVTYSNKTASHEEEEMRALKMIAEDVYSDNPALARRIITLSETVLCDRTSKLGSTFNAVERSGYVQTALRGRHVAKYNVEMGQDELRPHIPRFDLIAHNVLSGHMRPLTVYAEVHPYVAQMFTRREKGIEHAYATIPHAHRLDYETVLGFGEEKRNRAQVNFDDGKMAWDQFMKGRAV
jgi:hypothetical protein